MSGCSSVQSHVEGVDGTTGYRGVLLLLNGHGVTSRLSVSIISRVWSTQSDKPSSKRRPRWFTGSLRKRTGAMSYLSSLVSDFP